MGTITVNALAVISSNQISVTFGGDTLAGAGAYQVGGGLTNATITAFGSTSGMSCSTTGVLTPTSNGSLSAQNGTYMVVSSDQGYYRVSLSVTANEYSVVSEAEADAAFTAANTAGGGKTVRVRASNSWAGSGTQMANALSFASPVTFTGEAGCVLSRADFRAVTNLVIEGLEFSDPSLTGNLLAFYDPVSSVTIQDCTFHGKYYDPLGDYSAQGSYANGYAIRTISGGSGSSFSGTIQRCQLYDLLEGINIGVKGGALTIVDNEIFRTYSDCMKLTVEGTGLTAVKNISRNVMHTFLGIPADYLNPHIDCIQFLSTAVNNGLNMTNLTVRQNVAWEDVSVARGVDVQGIVAFTDGGAYNFVLKDAVVEGNSLHLSSAWGITFASVDGGTFKNNTITGSGSGGAVSAIKLYLDSNATVNAIDASANVCDAYTLSGSASFTTTGNVTLGEGGVTIPYSTQFDGPSFPVTAWADVKTAWSVASGTSGAIGSGRGTYGDVRDATGWSWT